MPSFRLTVRTPAGIACDETVDHVRAPGLDGSFGVLAKHAPMIAVLKAGMLQIRHDQKRQSLLVGDGILEIRDDAMTVLTSSAERQDEDLPH